MARNTRKQTPAPTQAQVPTTTETEVLAPVEVLPGTEAEATAKAAKRTGTVVPQKYKDKYGKLQSCGDDLVSFLLRSWGEKTDLEMVKATGIENGIWNERWERLNPGMQRMNLGNRMRTRVREGAVLQIVTRSGVVSFPEK